MHRAIPGVVCVVAGAVALAAQQAPVFRGGTSVVRIDATVLDRNGKPVVDLTQGDFEIKIDGQPRVVRTVEYERAASPAKAVLQPAALNSPPRDVTNGTPVTEPRLVVLVVDDLSISPGRGKGMFFAATKFVDSLPPSDVVAFTTTSGMSMLNPTMNRPAVDAALRHAAGDFIDPRNAPPSVDVSIADAVEIAAGDQSRRDQLVRQLCFGGQIVSQAQMESSQCPHDVDRKVSFLSGVMKGTVRRQIDALVGTISAMRVAPGLKELVVLSDGLAVAQRDQQAMFQPVARAAAAAGVHLNVLSEEPAMTDVSRTGPSHYTDDRELVMGLMTMTDVTGGSFYRVIGEPERFFGFVSQATSGIYHLGVEVPSNVDVKKDFTVSARVKAAGLTVHANRVAVLADPKAADVPTAQRVIDAVTKGVSNYGVPLTLTMTLRRGGDPGKVELGANVEVPLTAQAPLAVMYGLLDESGHVQTGRQIVSAAPTTDSYRISLSLPASAGARYRLRFAVADSSGRVGSIDAPISASLQTVGSFTTSDLLASWSSSTTKPRFLALSELPASATTLEARLELYPSARQPAPTNVKVHWILAGSSGTKPGDQTQAATASGDRLTSSVRFATEALPPGEYELQATVLVDGAPVGTLVKTIRRPARRA